MPHLRARRGPRTSGKIARVLALVEKYWDLIDDDLNQEFHISGMDYFRGTIGDRHRGRDWNEFLRRVDQLAEIEGTRVWAAKLSDDDMLDSLWEQYRKDRRAFDKVIAETRPTLVGFRRDIAALTTIANHVISLRMESNEGVARVAKHIDLPIFPMEAIEMRWGKLSLRKRTEGIEAAQAKWDQMKAAGVEDPYG